MVYVSFQWLRKYYFYYREYITHTHNTNCKQKIKLELIEYEISVINVTIFKRRLFFKYTSF